MRMVGLRACVVGALVAVFVLTSVPPSSATGAATLETLPPSSAGSAVRYRGGVTDNNTFAHISAANGVDFSDYLVLIVAVPQVTTGAQNCTGGLSTAHCYRAISLELWGEGGNDVLNVRTTAGSLKGAVVDAGEGDDTLTMEVGISGYAKCGPGFDRATVGPTVNVDTDCEVVKVI